MKFKSRVIIVIVSVIIICGVAAFFLASDHTGNEQNTIVHAETSDSHSSDNIAAGLPTFNATILDVREGSLLLEPLKGSAILSSADKVVVGVDDTSLFKKDDRVTVVYDGTVQETYPARIPKSSVYSVSLCGGVDDPEYVYETACGYSGYIHDDGLYVSCLNSDKMLISSVQHLPIFKFDTKEDLDSFTSKYFDHPKGYDSYNEMPFFDSTTAHCDEKFFKENTLFVIYLQAPSGSFRYGVDEIFNDGKSFAVHVVKTNDPEVFTTDMASWMLTVSAKKEAVQNCTVFDAALDS